ncbi:ATP-dependent RNA helicase DBP9 [Astathelohania contejeani]|uniref:ATP-dependent RNA helicase DBP9 n=1 Tax=Astathelohania contejeani TaxID=164912 RepID=A0ABQ7I2G5_9MICR|nr:ATP-dependent RNA helicase DBP9 [Thelohania contejeani]
MEAILDIQDGKDYICALPKSTFYSMIFCNKGIYIILSVYKNRCIELHNQLPNSTDLFESSNPKILITTPGMFIRSYQSMNIDDANKYVILEEPQLLYHFGYDTTMQEIRNLPRVTLIALSTDLRTPPFMAHPAVLTSRSEYFIDATEKEKFLTVFLLLKFKLINGQTVVFVRNEKIGQKLILFLKAFGLGPVDIVYETPQRATNFIVWDDTTTEGEFQYVIHLNNKKEQGIKEYKLDPSKIKEYHYRIEDVLKAITPAVLKGKKEFNFARFSRINENKYQDLK